MTNNTNYFKVGLFAMLSIALIIIFLVFLGISHLFQTSILAETYFNESVQGLNIGSPVKYRGVPVGKVTAISMASSIYNTSYTKLSLQEQRYIYVQFLLSESLGNVKINNKNVNNIIKENVKNGLRSSLAVQDLVGNAYLALNFIDDIQTPQLPISWQPKSIYIPSIPSTLSQLTDSISNIATQLNQINFKKVINDFDHVTLALDKSVKEIQKDQLSQKLSATLRDTSIAMQKLNLLISQANLFAANQQSNWENTFSALQQMSLNLSTLSNTLKNDPSAVIFGQAATPMDP